MVVRIGGGGAAEGTEKFKIRYGLPEKKENQSSVYRRRRRNLIPTSPEKNTAEILGADRLAPWEMFGDKGRRRFSDDQSLWIERKIFSVFPLIPGRSIRIIEMLADRRFTVDLNTNEVPWIIGALREAGNAKSGAVFSKKITIGRRSMVCSSVSNRAGVYIKLLCSYGGDNRRILHIPAGEKGEGWRNLANLLATTSAGDKSVTKKSKPHIQIQRSKADVSQRGDTSSNRFSAKAAKGKKRWQEKNTDVDGWKEGFLPDLLKFGLKSSYGEPPTSHEAARRFAWKKVPTERGFGTTVVEIASRGVSPAMKIVSVERSPLVVSEISSSMKFYKSRHGGGTSVGFTGGDDSCIKRPSDEDGGAEDARSVKGADIVGVSSSGKAPSVFHKAVSVSGYPIPNTSLTKTQNHDDFLAGGPHDTYGVQPSSGESRASLSFEEQSGNSVNIDSSWVSGLGNGLGFHEPTSEEKDSADKAGSEQIFGIGQESYESIQEGPVNVDNSWAVGLGNGLDAEKVCSEQIIGLPCRPRRGLISVGPRKGTGPVSDCSWIADGSVSIPVNLSTISEEVSELPPYVRRVVSAGSLSGDDSPLYLARYEDITIADNADDYSLDSFFNESNGGPDVLGEEIGGVTVLEECITVKVQEPLSVMPAGDSPASYCSGAVVEEKSSEVGFSCPEEYCLGSVHYQRSFKIAEMLRQRGFFQNMDRAVLQAHIIKDLLQDA